MALDLLRLPREEQTFDTVVKIFTDLADGEEGNHIVQALHDEALAFKEKKAKAGKKGGLRKPKQRQASLKQTEAVLASAVAKPSHTLTHSLTHTNIQTEKSKRSKSKEPFSIPTASDVYDYVKEISSSVNPQAFLDHYDSNGWMVGKVKMKSWKATIRKWNTNQKENPNATSKPQQFLTANEKRDNAAASTFDFLSRPGGMLDGVDFSELLSGGQGDGPQHRSGQKEVQPRNDPGSTALERNSSQ